MTNKNRALSFLYFLLPALTATIFLAAMPTDGQNAIIFGFSKSRLMVAAALFLGILVSFMLAVTIWQRPERASQWLGGKISLPLIAISSGLIFGAASAILSIPDKYLGEMWAIAERIHLLVIWLMLTSLQVILGLIGWQISRGKASSGIRWETVKAGGISLAILVLLWAFIALTGLGLNGESSFWSKAGVPLLWPQIYLALGLALGFQIALARAKNYSTKAIWLDIGAIALIGLAAVVLWNQQSFVPGVFNTQPRPPSNEIYPINDSLIFDLSAQKMLVGGNLMSDAQDKPTYIAYLAIMHLLAGSGFANFYLLQIISFAFIPICGFWLGKSLHSRPLGLLFGVLLVIKEQNAIALTNYIHVSTSKMILSEPLTTLGILLFTIFLVRWLKSPRSNNPNLWFAGGVLGLTSLARLNSITILPAAILLIGLAINFKWKRWLTASALIVFFVLLSALPWITRSYIITGNPISFITGKTSGVLVNTRYNPIVNQNPVQNSTLPESKWEKYLKLGQGMASNYLHNLVGITLMLPPSLETYRLLDMVRLPYWKTDWNGSLAVGGFWIILGILTLTALGIAAAWTRWRAAGLTPLIAILGYNLTTAVSLTSGGRYLVPIDWGVLFYFSIGLFETALWLLALFDWPQTNEPVLAQSSRAGNGKNYQRLILTGLLFLFLGAAPVLLENLPPERYRTKVNVDDFIQANRSLPTNLAESISQLAKDPQAKVFQGRALYPRYYGENKGDGPTLEEDALIGSAGFDHLSFLLINDSAETAVILPINGKLSPMIAGADTWVVGCQRANYIEAVLVVFRTKDASKVYQQESLKTNCQ